MNKIDFSFINIKTNISPNTIKIKLSPNLIEIKLNIFNITNYELVNELGKFENIINIYNSIKKINLIFDKSIDIKKTNHIITKIHNVLYQYYNITNKIKLSKVNKESNNLMLELDKYKSIVMDPNKNPNTYLAYVKSRVPSTHKISVYNIKKSNEFPLSKAVGCWLGWCDGCIDGITEGCEDGWLVGCRDGLFDGCMDGCMDGLCVGWLDGWDDGDEIGWWVGCNEGRRDGWEVGWCDGW